VADIKVKYLCSTAAKALLTEAHREWVAKHMLKTGMEAGMKRGQSIFAVVTGQGGTQVKVALDRRLDPAEDSEWVVIFDPDGAGIDFQADPAGPTLN
jgi:hypothetical protein